MLKMKSRFSEKVAVSIKSIAEGHHKVEYKGIKAIRCPFDYVIYQMIIWEVKPDLIIEIGTNTGGGALYLADLLDLTGQGEVHSIDLTIKSSPAVAAHNRIKLFSGGWEAYDLALATGFERVLIIEDASHLYEHTAGALEKFHDLVTPGSYFIVEDGIVNELGLEKEYHGGPLKAIREFLPKHPEYVVDRKWCDFFGVNATFNVKGYLKKVK